jgi:aspartate/methionine/tyrosine aminotransferase
MDLIPSSEVPAMPDALSASAFRAMPRTGVIYVTAEAARLGYSSRAPAWCNLGQGQPETGPLPGAPARIEALEIGLGDQEYAPTAGLMDLREAVADLYNRRYRVGMPSRYSAENVCIAGGGRTALTRAAACLGHVNLGHFLPDYTAYEELLDIFKAFTPIPILLDGGEGYVFGVDALRREILGRGLSALLLSNPCNPTGHLVAGDDLAAWVATARSLDCSLLIDEFYAHYVYGQPTPAAGISAARYVENVDRDPVLLFDGLTKNWRYPGWRLSWAIGPKPVIEALASAGSFLDGGGSRPLQRAAIPLVAADHALMEARAIQQAFTQKRQLTLDALRRLGLRVDGEPQGTFYAWASVESLPPPLNDGMAFFRAALDQKVITVPGQFFDVNPGKRRRAGASRFKSHVRFSFGPAEATLAEAFARLQTVVADAGAKPATKTG